MDEMQDFLDILNLAFDDAEILTSQQFNSQTCSLQDKDGNETCPICYFRIRVKEFLKGSNAFQNWLGLRKKVTRNGADTI